MADDFRVGCCVGYRQRQASDFVWSTGRVFAMARAGSAFFFSFAFLFFFSFHDFFCLATCPRSRFTRIRCASREGITGALVNGGPRRPGLGRVKLAGLGTTVCGYRGNFARWLRTWRFPAYQAEQQTAEMLAAPFSCGQSVRWPVNCGGESLGLFFFFSFFSVSPSSPMLGLHSMDWKADWPT